MPLNIPLIRQVQQLLPTWHITFDEDEKFIIKTQLPNFLNNEDLEHLGKMGFGIFSIMISDKGTSIQFAGGVSH